MHACRSTLEDPTSGSRAEGIDLWLTILGDPQAALTVSQLGRELRTMPVAQLAKLPHIGMARAARIFSVVELGRRLLSMPLVRGQALTNPQDVFAAYGKRLLDLERESFWAAYLDVKNRVVCDELIGMGSTAVCPVVPVDIFRTAIRVGALSLIVMHSHPSSGDPTPSESDDALTAQLSQVSRLLGIGLLDHIVLGDCGYYSYAEHLRLGLGQERRLAALVTDAARAQELFSADELEAHAEQLRKKQPG